MFAFRKLAIVFTVAAMCASTSAFAEERHRDATDSNESAWRAQRTDRNSGDRTHAQTQQAPQQQQQRYDRNTARSDQNLYRNGDNRQYRNDQQNRNNDNQQYRNDQQYRNNDNRQYRNDNQQNRNNDRQYRNEGRTQAGTYRGDHRSDDRRDADYRGGSYDRDRAYSTHGRVTRYERYGSGYRVWLGGGYPFFVTDSWWRLHHLRVGLDIVLGGYWNPAGYYDVYDYNPYNTAGDLRGLVESVDYRRGTLVLRDDISGNFVTTVLRGNDPRLGDLRPGDYVDLSGEWSRGGVFSAYNVQNISDGRGYDDRGYDGRY